MELIYRYNLIKANARVRYFLDSIFNVHYCVMSNFGKLVELFVKDINVTAPNVSYFIVVTLFESWAMLQQMQEVKR